MKAANNNFITHNGSKPVEDVNEASFLYGQLVLAEMEKIGMRYSYRHILKPLIENSSLTQLELVRITNQKAPTVSITLRNMEHDGLVKREKKSDDRRETHVCITEKGRKVYKSVVAALDKSEKIAVAGISREDLAKLSEILEKVKKNLNGALK